MYLDSDRRPSLTPQLAMRVAILGGLALLAFALIFFRLWYLQVLSGDSYRAEANDNRTRAITVRAPRGEIVDREGRLLVGNRTGLAVKVSPNRLPDSPEARSALYRRLARVLGLREQRIARSVKRQLRDVSYSAATVKQDVPRDVVAYLLENQDDFKGVTVERVFLREYPNGPIGAHIVGHVGEVTEEQLDSQRYRDVVLGDRIGQEGIEAQYDRFLRGRNGATRIVVDALGVMRDELDTRQPEQGRQLRLSLDLDVQRAGQEALGGATGAFVVMNVHNGEVLGLGSAPTFDPNRYGRDYNRLAGDDGKPLLNRATGAGYPTGSTFKLVTALAGLEGGLVTADEPVYDPGFIEVGGTRFANAGDAVNGTISLRQALSVSSDVYFYRLGLEANSAGNGLLIQEWARKLGMGRLTGIDLPGEQPGRVPTPKWRRSWMKQGLTDRPWAVGDNINLSVGQGDLLADPLQLAVAYAALANPDGRVVRPRLGQRVEDSSSRPIQELQAAPSRRVEVDPANRQAVLDGLRAAASEPGGTSTSVFEGFPIDIAGKTGTAEKGNYPDQSWYAALAPYPNPKYVVITTFEAGGFGAETAAPAARKILAALFDVKDGGAVPSGTAPD